MIGRVLGNFRIVSPLGHGGMGEVWKAEQVSVGHRVAAVKVLARNAADPEHAIERLKREGAIAARIKHPGIASILDAGVTDGVHWIALEFVDGETLAERLRHGPLATSEACRVATQVADVLAHAHARGVLHRDIKPSNIMLEGDGRVVLLDFGLALTEGRTRLTPDGVMVGTPQYLAPEVISGHKADARSDVYGLGVVFYECLTGAPPFRSQRTEGAFHGPLRENPQPPSTRRAGLGPAWDALALRALAREPGLRVASAAEFAAALRGLESASRPEGAYTPANSDETTGEVVAPPPPARMKRLAVVPFHEMSGGRDGDAFADGFAEAVCGALARYPGLEVMPPTTTRHIAREGTASVARELNVDHVLSGTVQRAGERLRVTCSLVNGAQGTTVFAESFEGTREQLFTLEDQLVKALASALRLAPPSPQPDRHTPDPIAHEKLLQARGYLQRFDNEASVDGAIKLLEPMAHDGGASASVWAELGRAYRQKYHHDMRQVWIERSLHACEQALLADPRHARALACLGVVHELLGREEEAERELLRALDLEPELPAALSGLISLYTKQGRLDEAESLARRASALRPRDWVVPNLLGVARFQAGRYAEAITAWEQVRRLVPDNARAVYNIAAAHFEMGRLDEAERLYRESLEMQRSAIALSGLGTVLFYQGEYLGAESAFERAVGLKPMDAKLWGNLADARRWLPGRDEQARDDYRQAIGLAVEYLERNPTDLQMRGDLVSWLACSGDLESATSQLERVLSMDPANLHALRIAVTVHELSGRRDAALASLREALKAGSDSGPFERDRDLVALRETAEYKTLRVERHDAPRAAERPSPTPAPGE